MSLVRFILALAAGLSIGPGRTPPIIAAQSTQPGQRRGRGTAAAKRAAKKIRNRRRSRGRK